MFIGKMHKTVSDGEKNFPRSLKFEIDDIALYSNLNLRNSNRKELWKDHKKTQKHKSFRCIR